MTHGLTNMPQESTIERCNACYSAGGETAVAHAFLHTSCCEVLCSHVIPNFKTDHALHTVAHLILPSGFLVIDERHGPEY